MRCLTPRTVGFKNDGRTITWSQKTYSKEYPTFQLPCGKCIECRLEYARTWAIRCVHEAQMHENNGFITLTYTDEKLESKKLIYKDWVEFIKKLRDKIFRETVKKAFGPGHWDSLTSTERKQFRKDNKELLEKNQIGVFVTGEYGDKKKRPHWHAIVFNYWPSDAKESRKTQLQDQCYESKELEKIWGKGKVEIGKVTFKSAGYVARYATKKLVHGKDNEHDYKPISKKSSKHAIGKKWLEKNYKDIFNYGKIIMEDGKTGSIPRYYIKWLEKNHPLEWKRYVTQIQPEKEKKAKTKEEELNKKYWEENDKRTEIKNGTRRKHLITRQETKIKIINERAKRLNTYQRDN